MAQLERCWRAEDGNPRRRWGLQTVRKRLLREGWREKAQALLRDVVPEGTERMRARMGGAPWREREVEWDIEGTKAEGSEERRRGAEERLNRGEQPDFIIYTDGSVTDGVLDGGWREWSSPEATHATPGW